MVRLLYPQISLDIDSTYNKNPKELKIWVKQEEERLIAIKKPRKTQGNPPNRRSEQSKNWND